MNKYEILKNYFGHIAFRNGQEEVIDSILAGRDVIGIMPTGAGKSICYQLPALMLNGITIVISPLISLMKDQVNSLLQAGIRCAFINSSLSYEEYKNTLYDASNGVYKILYVAPERLTTEAFINLSMRIRVSMVVVDEAHCVSHWGQDFRPSYLRINEFMTRLPYRPIISAFTATATAEVKTDIIKILQLNNAFEIMTGFNRENLYFEVRKPRNKTEELIKILNIQKENSVIVYCISRKTVETVCAKLNDEGFSAVRYHAGLSDNERLFNQDEFIYDRARIMVATNAFGMGIDKSNVSMVIHYNMPKNIESYYQEAGRAGRDGENAQCILLYSAMDIRTNNFLIEQNRESETLSIEEKEAIQQRDRERLKQMTFYCTTKNCLRQFILNYFGEKSSSVCENCSNCNGNFEEIDITIPSQKILSCIYRMKQSYGINMVIDVLRGSRSGKVLDLQFDKLSTYGIMREKPAMEIREIIDYLLYDNYIFATDTQYPYLKLTAKSKEILFERKQISMKRLKRDNAVDTYGKSIKTKVYSIDMELFNTLRALRNDLATEQNVPAYVIFSDASLRDMCIVLPKTSAEFLNVSGVGHSKATKYGEVFLEQIKLYLSTHQDVESKSLELGNTSVLEHINSSKSKILPLSEAVSLSKLVERIVIATGIIKQNKFVFNSIINWLISEGILIRMETTKGKNVLKTTSLSLLYGIIEEEKISKLGTSYVSILYEPKAQKFIIDNFDKISNQ